MIGIAWRQTSKAALKEAGATPPRLDTQGLLDVQVRACRAVDLPFAPHVLAGGRLTTVARGHHRARSPRFAAWLRARPLQPR